MPTYEYRCGNEHSFEQFQKMSDPPVESCPQCGAPAERVLSGGAGLLFKGSGFYITDYRSDTYKKAAESDQKASSSSAGGKESASKESGGKESGGKESGGKESASKESGGKEAGGSGSSTSSGGSGTGSGGSGAE